MDRKERIAIIKRIAQTASTQTSSPTPVIPAQKSSSASTLFPSINIGWDSGRVIYINRIISMMDMATAIGTNNKYNFQKLWNARFPSGAESEFTSPVKDLLILFRKMFIQFLNSSTPFQKALSSTEVSQRINVILQSPELTKLEQVNPSGPLGNAGVSLASMRQLLMNILPANISH